jgi:ASC-1-like (ASCH) protein
MSLKKPYFKLVADRTKTVEVRVAEDLLDHEDMRTIGGDLGESRIDLLQAIRDIYPPEKEALGVLAIEVERICVAIDHSTDDVPGGAGPPIGPGKGPGTGP